MNPVAIISVNAASEVMHFGQALALNVMNEYVVFLKAEPDEGISPWKGFFGEDCVHSAVPFLKSSRVQESP